jgi:4-hydroxybenzoate polyprenyltransferase
MNTKPLLLKGFQLPGHFFFSNYFYGICAVGLSIEASLQQQIPLNGFLYYFLIFITTILYYAYPYIRKTTMPTTNPRTIWYNEHYQLMRWNQIIITIILSVALAIFLKDHVGEVLNMTGRQWTMFLVFPIVGALYYGSNSSMGKYNLRRIGWLKPFVIGFTWAGLVTVYPGLFHTVIKEVEYSPGLVGLFLFIKNLMFVTLLCILFDVKDFASDRLYRMRTFVVRLGLRKTIVYLLLPLALIGLATFIGYAATHQFNWMKVVLNAIPFLLLIAVAVSLLRRRRSLLYYLIVVDGLMLAKAVCGIIAMLYF